MKICKSDFTMEICKNNHILWKYVQKIFYCGNVYI